MTIERAHRPHWGAKTEVKEIEPGHTEIISQGFLTLRQLVVESPDQIRVDTTIGRYKDTPAIGPRGKVYEEEEINQNSRLLSPTSTSTISLLVGERIIFSWKKTE